jgi:hypothetical protein
VALDTMESSVAQVAEGTTHHKRSVAVVHHGVEDCLDTLPLANTLITDWAATALCTDHVSERIQVDSVLAQKMPVFGHFL